MTRNSQHLRLVDGEVARDGAPPAEGTRARGEAPRPDDDASKALEHLVNRFDAFIRRSARRHGLSGGDIDEVVQDLRLRMWKSLGTADLIRRAKASYVYRAAISASLDIIRRRRARRFEGSSLDDVATDSVADSRQRSDAGAERNDLAASVHRALGMLVESRRAVVRMHLAGYDRLEIAELLGWSEAKTRNLLYRGLGDLRAILSSWGIGPEAGT
jgi:RNA polymerase sigma-70 factor, ECF subfamily